LVFTWQPAESSGYFDEYKFVTERVMSKPVNKTMIGLFVVGAIALVVVAIAVLGSGKFFKKQFTYYMVFEGSVKGLNIGSPVVFRGVKIGAVSDIHMHLNYETKELSIVVYINSEQSQVEAASIDEALAEKIKRQGQYVMMQEFIDRGLRAQLEMQSIVTGQLQIALDFHPDRPAVYKEIDKEVREIPTIPTPIQQLTKRLEGLPLEEIVNNLNSAADGIAKFVQSPELKESVVNLNIALKDVQSLVRNVDAQIQPLSAQLSETIRDIQKLVKETDVQVASLGTNLNAAIGDGRKLIQDTDGSLQSVKVNLDGTISQATSALKQAELLIQELQVSVRADSSLMYRFNETLREVEKAARSLRTLTDYFERHPEALISGKGDAGGK
jgi:paraquat-inducible protein B